MTEYSSIKNQDFHKHSVNRKMTFMIKPYCGHDISEIILNEGMALDKKRPEFSALSCLEKFKLLDDFTKDYVKKNYVSAKFRTFGDRVDFNSAIRNGKIIFESMTPRRGYYIATFWTLA